jgi:hypothetical protein
MTANMFAQAPENMSYQAVVRDGSNNLVSSTSVGMQISILQGSSSGAAVYIETQSPTSNTNGLVSLEIGSGTVISGDFTSIDWANGPYFIKTETDPTGGTNYTITGTSQLLSVPYALHAKTAETLTGGISENDPIFGASVASGITVTDTTNWNNKLDSYTETDPIFGASVASGITGADTTNWNNKQEQLTAGTNITITGNTISAAGSGVFNHYIGELYGGGIIVAVWKENGVEKGLIASLTDISASAQYSSITGTLIGPSARSPYDGQANTTAIVAQGDVSGAAYLCDNYSAGGFNDWYLPSAWEINQCYNAAVVVNNILGATDGFQFDYYWSSTENGFGNAWYQSFGTGSTSVNNKNLIYRVRAVRKF